MLPSREAESSGPDVPWFHEKPNVEDALETADPFDSRCYKIFIPRGSKKVMVAANPDGKGKVSIDDRLELYIQAPNNSQPVFHPVNFFRGSIVEERDAFDIGDLFPDAGTYFVGIQAVDLYKPYKSISSDIYLVFELKPRCPDPKGCNGDPFAWIIVVVLIGVTIVSVIALFVRIRRLWQPPSPFDNEQEEWESTTGSN